MRFLLVLLLLPLLAAATPAPVTVLTIDGPITPASAAYFSQGLKRSVENGSSLVVLKLDTPGGLDTAMRDIIKGVLASPIPVATFVFPSGARAASAGTYILYASHVAAMAPGTNLGAATPVQIGIGGGGPEPAAPPPERPKEVPLDKETTPPTGQQGALTKKQISDSAAYIRSLAQLRGRNVEWAEKAVREAVSLSAEEALQLHVVDYVAQDVRSLLDRVHGARVAVGGTVVALDTAGAELVAFDPDWRTQLLSVIASPSLALVLMMLGIYGLLFEFSNPGFVLPGVVGGICLLLALFAFQMLPINVTGLGLIALGSGLSRRRGVPADVRSPRRRRRSCVRDWRDHPCRHRRSGLWHSDAIDPCARGPRWLLCLHDRSHGGAGTRTPGCQRQVDADRPFRRSGLGPEWRGLGDDPGRNLARAQHTAAGAGPAGSRNRH